MKTLLTIGIVLITLTAQAQRLENKPPRYHRYIPLGVIAGTSGTIIGNAIGGKPAGIAGGALFTIASSLLVRNRTDAITSLHTAGAGFLCTAGLTIGLNKKRGRASAYRSTVDCFKF